MSVRIAPRILVQAEPFDLADEAAKVSAGRVDIGAVVTFTGLCRSEGGQLAALELEHYPGMAEAELERVAEEALQRWPLDGLTIIHRYGKLEPGAPIVLVVTASAHRQAAIDGASFLMDFLKTRAPFWKKEHPARGGTGDWVDAKVADDAQAARWQKQR
jgi:molybdopterin synthase catalytic subunit